MIKEVRVVKLQHAMCHKWNKALVGATIALSAIPFFHI